MSEKVKTLIITLKSGAVLKVKYTGDAVIKHGDGSGSATGWSITGIESHAMLYIDPNEIAAAEVMK